MTSPGSRAEPAERHLATLCRELERRGVRCELDTRGIWPRLRIRTPDQTAAAAFDNNIIAVRIRGWWWYCWPWVEMISPVSSVTRAADIIVSDLDIGYHDGPRIGIDGHDGPALAARGKLRAQPGIRGLRNPGLLSADRGLRSPRLHALASGLHRLLAFPGPPRASQAQCHALLARLRDELIPLGAVPAMKPGSLLMGVWPRVYATVSRDGVEYAWIARDEIHTHPARDVAGAAQRIATLSEVLISDLRRRSAP